MFNLPTELTLHILSYLPLDSLSRLRTVCKSWNEFCIFHEYTIYREAACLYTYIPRPTTMLDDLRSLYSKKVLEGVKTWKDLCQKRWQIQRNWKGKGPSILVEHKSTSPEWTHLVHRIKVDEMAGYIMTTSNQGGILVTDLNEDRLLWALPPWYVRQYAHLEYGQGYMIFDRLDGDKEVWRRLSDITEHVVDESSAPDEIQREVNNLIYEWDPSSNNGCFRPWAVLRMPESTSAFRFVYPTLIVAAYDRAFLWDIPSGKLIQTLHGCQFIGSELGNNEYLGRMKYVEISERHVFLVGQFRLRVFSRATGKCVWDLSSSERGYGLWKYMPGSSHSRTPGSALVRYEMMTTKEPYRLRSQNRLLMDKFVSAHVSACGRHFVALLSGCRLLVVYNFEKVSSEEDLYSQTLNIQIASHRLYESIYLAFDYGRISVVTTNGVFFIEVDESKLENITNEAPILNVCRAFRLSDETSLDAVSCLMMSDTRLYLNWNPTTLIAGDENENENEEDPFVPWSEAEEDDQDFEPLDGNTMVVLPHIDIELPQSSSSSVFSVNFARY